MWTVTAQLQRSQREQQWQLGRHHPWTALAEDVAASALVWRTCLSLNLKAVVISLVEGFQTYVESVVIVASPYVGLQ